LRRCAPPIAPEAEGGVTAGELAAAALAGPVAVLGAAGPDACVAGGGSGVLRPVVQEEPARISVVASASGVRRDAARWSDFVIVSLFGFRRWTCSSKCAAAPEPVRHGHHRREKQQVDDAADRLEDELDDQPQDDEAECEPEDFHVWMMRRGDARPLARARVGDPFYGLDAPNVRVATIA
jgi:hypothetical protein